jgi:hypothetical protein
MQRPRCERLCAAGVRACLCVCAVRWCLCVRVCVHACVPCVSLLACLLCRFTMPRVSAVQIEMFRADEPSILLLNTSAALGKLVQCHAGCVRCMRTPH